MPVACIYFGHASGGDPAIDIALSSESETFFLPSSGKKIIVRIHKYGTLFRDIENPIMHDFLLEDRQSRICCDSNYILSVGEMGIIGRGLSVVDDCGTVLGNGIIGWN